MSLLDNLPHKCTIRKRIHTLGSTGGNKQTYENVSTSVDCWEQAISASEKMEYKKRGVNASRYIYFSSPVNLDETHQILITERFGVSVSSPKVLDVVAETSPDASVGFDLLYQVLVDDRSSNV